MSPLNATEATPLVKEGNNEEEENMKKLKAYQP